MTWRAALPQCVAVRVAVCVAVCRLYYDPVPCSPVVSFIVFVLKLKESNSTQARKRVRNCTCDSTSWRWGVSLSSLYLSVFAGVTVSGAAFEWLTLSSFVAMRARFSFKVPCATRSELSCSTSSALILPSPDSTESCLHTLPPHWNEHWATPNEETKGHCLNDSDQSIHIFIRIDVHVYI